MLVQIEGPSAVGKTTLIRGLLTEASPEVFRAIDVKSMEYAGDELAGLLGQFIRRLSDPVDQLEALFLFCARMGARCRLMSTFATDDHALLLADRFHLSLHVQARLAGLSRATADKIIEFATRGLQPQLTVLLDVGYDEHVQRRVRRGDNAQPRPLFERQRWYFSEEFGRVMGPKVRLDTSAMKPEDIQFRIFHLINQC